MRHLLKAVFDHQGDARRVLDALLAAGYAPAAATLTDVCPRGPDAHPDGVPAPGCHTLELAVGSVEDARRAAAIIGRFAAVETEVVPGADRDDWPVEDDDAGPDQAATRRNLYRQDVEADLAENSELLHAGAASSAWQRMTAAVRHGWQRVRH